MNQPKNPEPPVDSDQVEVDEDLGHDQSDSDGDPDRAKQPKGQTIGKDSNDLEPGATCATAQLRA